MKRGGSEVLGFLSLTASVQFFGNILSGSLDLLYKESHYPETAIWKGHVERPRGETTWRGHVERPRGGPVVNSPSPAKASSHTYFG